MRACGINELHDRIDRLETLMSLYRSDLLTVLSKDQGLFPCPGVEVETQHPLAIKSDDHRFPRGTKNDNTRYPRFCYKCEEVFKKPLRFLDVGCAGGGLVFDFLSRGHFAIGIEGSDYSLRCQRAEWPLIPMHLFTCDVTKPFSIKSQLAGEVLKFDIISAWEVLEHIPECALPQFFGNVLNHLADDGFFVASVATFEDKDLKTGAVWHVTVRPQDWWLRMVGDLGFVPAREVFDARDFPRAPGGAPSISLDLNAEIDRTRGFHLVLKRRMLDPPKA